MKICLSATGKTLNCQIDPRFGRCQNFLIVETKTKKVKAIPNPGVNYGRGAGISAAQLVVNEKVKAVITGNIGPNAFNVLSQAGVEIYPGTLGLTCQKALDMFSEKKLKKAKAPSPCGPGAKGLSSGAGRRGIGGRP